MTNFWKKLNKPFFCLAPMADVTDYAFRQIITKYGKPDVLWTEFVSADGLCSVGQKKLMMNLKFKKNEHPIVAQIFGSKPENIKKASALCKKLGFDGVDINMGCPDKSVEKQNSGAALMKNHKLAKKIILAAKEGARGLPISVKTRIGYYKNEIDIEWLKNILEENIAVLTVHLRTRKEMSKVGAHWEFAKKVVALRNKYAKDTLIILNGDVVDLSDAKKKANDSGCDGVMLGRAIFGNPWLFNKKFISPETSEKLKILAEHTTLFDRTFKNKKNYSVMKKHFKAYVNGFDGAKELRASLMETKSAIEVKKIVDKHLRSE